ncbi:hypothetical protein BDZ91DRAFT_723487 [Kalaharituber pfeilii]|nr:hypothetical protein BDZ91DRAFT_723487 [Kalaharituber pfeilii]
MGYTITTPDASTRRTRASPLTRGCHVHHHHNHLQIPSDRPLPHQRYYGPLAQHRSRDR